jgi:hypothetical protein
MSDKKSIIIKLTPALITKLFKAYLKQLKGIGPTQGRGTASDYFDTKVLTNDKKVKSRTISSGKINDILSSDDREMLNKITAGITARDEDTYINTIIPILNTERFFDRFMTPAGRNRRRVMFTPEGEFPSESEEEKEEKEEKDTKEPEVPQESPRKRKKKMKKKLKEAGIAELLKMRQTREERVKEIRDRKQISTKQQEDQQEDQQEEQPAIDMSENRLNINGRMESNIDYKKRLTQILKTKEDFVDIRRITDLIRSVDTKIKAQQRYRKRQETQNKRQQETLKLAQKATEKATEKLTEQVEQIADVQTVNELNRQTNTTRIMDNIDSKTEGLSELLKEELQEIRQQILANNDRNMRNIQRQITAIIDRKESGMNDVEKRIIKNRILKTRNTIREKIEEDSKSILDSNVSSQQKQVELIELQQPRLTDMSRSADRIINALPERYQAVFGGFIRNVLSGQDVTLNDVVAGTVGLGVAVGINPQLGVLAGSTVAGLMDQFDINLEDYLFNPVRTETKEGDEQQDVQNSVETLNQNTTLLENLEKEEDEEDATLNAVLSNWYNNNQTAIDELAVRPRITQPPSPRALPPPNSNISEQPGGKEPEKHSDLSRLVTEARTLSDSDADEFERQLREAERGLEVALREGRDDDFATRVGEMVDLERQRIERLPTYEEIVFGPEQQARIPAILNRDRNRQQQRGMIAGVLGGAGMALARGGGAGQALAMGAMGGIAGGSLMVAIEGYLRQRNVDPQSRRGRGLVNTLLRMPPRILASLVGLGAGALVGGVGRINETPIEVSEDIINQTNAELQQISGQKNKQWAKRIIRPSTTILDKSRQENYADDVEFALFDYVPVTEQGAGTVKSNPLVRNQFINNEIQMENAGVYIPTVLFNTLVDASSLTDRQMEALFKGAKPLIKDPSYVKYNGDTFDNVAQYQYPNQENTAIGILDPYRFYSRVDNHWSFNPDSELFTVNP